MNIEKMNNWCSKLKLLGADTAITNIFKTIQTIQYKAWGNMIEYKSSSIELFHNFTAKTCKFIGSRYH